ncbi:MAG: HD domain-containing protein [Bacilli bacterium]|nr:HD domain-containing protein [Bacilli bacterium]
MSDIERDTDYVNLVGSILYDDKFNSIKEIEHHGISRYDHSVKVSYYSYKIAKTLKLNYKDVAKAGLLHDYFLSDPSSTFKDKFKSTFTHPKLALATASSEYEINDLEADIIKSHMFPVNCLTVPKYAESWVVNGVDKFIGTKEFLQKFTYQFIFITNLVILCIFNLKK